MLGGVATAAALVSAAPASATDASDLTAFAPRPPAPALALVDLDGRVHDMAALRGQVVLVNFWATWCGPCIAEMASMDRAWTRLRERGVIVLAVNAGDSEDKIRRFLARNPVSFPVLLDSTTRISAAWWVGGLPASYVVDADGFIAAGAVGSRDWDRPELVAALTEMAATVSADRHRH